jgi:hypothetical protein
VCVPPERDNFNRQRVLLADPLDELARSTTMISLRERDATIFSQSRAPPAPLM